MCHHNEETALPTDLYPVSGRAMRTSNLNNASYNQSLSRLNCSIHVYLHQDSKGFPGLKVPRVPNIPDRSTHSQLQRCAIAEQSEAAGGFDLRHSQGIVQQGKC